MNTTTLFEGAEDKQLFAEIIIDVIESKHRKYEREHRESGRERVPLANIHFGIVSDSKGNFAGIGDHDGNTGGPCLQTIAKMQGNPNENLLITAQHMLDLFCTIREIERVENVYKLSTSGALYKHLTQELGAMWTDKEGNALWTDQNGNPLWKM